jgi:hypothetical protein
VDGKSKQTGKTQYQGKYQTGREALKDQNQPVQDEKYQGNVHYQKSGDAARQFEQVPFSPISRIDFMVYQQHRID